MADLPYYVTLADDPTFWLVIRGSRTMVESPSARAGYGLFEVRVISLKELDAIPAVGANAHEDEEQVVEVHG